jgi:Undecaprenyl-phosphate glucose phosphotransferase
MSVLVDDTVKAKSVKRSALTSGHSLSPSIVSGVALIIEVAILLICGIASYFWLVSPSAEQQTTYLWFITLNLSVTIIGFLGYRLYRLKCLTNLEYSLQRMILCVALAFAVVIVLAFFLQVSDQVSRLWLLEWFLAVTGLLIVERVIFKYVLIKLGKLGYLTRNVAVFGCGDLGVRLVNVLHRANDPWVRIVGVFDDRVGRVPRVVEGYPVLGNLDALLNHARLNRVDDVVLALPWAAEDRIVSIIDRLEQLPVEVRIGPDVTGLRFYQGSYSRFSGIPMLNVSGKPISGWSSVLKTLEDYVIGTCALICLAPLMLIVVAAIKIESRGPVLFRQKRYGFNNKLIEVYKFRSMHHHLSDKNAEKLAAPGDPRITRLGAFLRRTSIDELPQLFNVLRGEMSLVGPRPHATRAKAAGRLYEEVVEEYAKRHRVKPGLTGWAQVNGWRGNTDTEEKIKKRVEYDLFYIENWSVIFDLKIMLLTVISAVRGTNAH